jgi:hypothetical protein
MSLKLTCACSGGWRGECSAVGTAEEGLELPASGGFDVAVTDVSPHVHMTEVPSNVWPAGDGGHVGGDAVVI